jgi:hypothetical protein
MCAAPAGAAGESAAAEQKPTDADRILQETLSILPVEPLRVTGELITRKRHGVVLGRLQFEMFLHWGATPSLARYTLRDALGRNLEQLTVTRPLGEDARFEYAAGETLTNAPLPDLFLPIRDTDVSWMDLALSFLWWKGGTLKGSERVLDRDCLVLDVPAPPDPAATPVPTRYASVRLWIEKESRMLFRAEGSNSEGQVVRWLWVRSFKKFGDRWLIKDMEIQQADGAQRTKLQIQDAKEDGAESKLPSSIETDI